MCALCDDDAAEPGQLLCKWCRNDLRAAIQMRKDEEDAALGFEDVGDFTSDDPVERWRAHQASKGRFCG